MFSAQELVCGGGGAAQILMQADVDGRQMNGRCKADARAGSDKSLHIYLYTNNARCVARRVSESHINRQRLEGTGRGRRVKKYLFKICTGVIVGWRVSVRESDHLNSLSVVMLD